MSLRIAQVRARDNYEAADKCKMDSGLKITNKNSFHELAVGVFYLKLPEKRGWLHCYIMLFGGYGEN